MSDLNRWAEADMLRALIVAILILPAVASAWQIREWPVIDDSGPLVELAKEKIPIRERYLTQSRKLDFAFLPEKEWPEAVSRLKPQAVLIERGYLLIALVLDIDHMQAFAVIVDEKRFKEDSDDMIVESAGHDRIKRVIVNPKKAQPGEL
ncbi:MAG: hypothetical protein HZA31_01885 [Opitutae bacterium]|nr:hypothetical protein [Opitutae bacterium]